MGKIRPARLRKVSTLGREYEDGVPLTQDLRSLVIVELKALADDQGALPRGSLAKIAKQFRLAPCTVGRLWKQYQNTGSVTYQPVVNRGRTSVSEADVQFINFLKTDDPSMPLAEVKDKLLEFSTIENIHETTISRIIRQDLNMTYKKITRCNKNRFSDDNMVYTQQFIDYIQGKNPNQLKFMDEMGVKLTDAHKRYGHSTKGTRAVSLTRHDPHANCTLSLLMGVNGVCYSKVINGASNMAEYIQYFTEASEAYTEDGIPALQRGDVIIVDNASIHHNEAERILSDFFTTRDIDYIFLPTYSPDFNPAELVFSKIKQVIKGPNYAPILHASLKVAVLHAVHEITAFDCAGFFRKTSIINL